MLKFVAIGDKINVAIWAIKLMLFRTKQENVTLIIS